MAGVSSGIHELRHNRDAPWALVEHSPSGISASEVKRERRRTVGPLNPVVMNAAGGRSTAQSRGNQSFFMSSIMHQNAENVLGSKQSSREAQVG